MRLRYLTTASLIGLAALAGCGSHHHAAAPTTVTSTVPPAPPSSAPPATAAAPTTATTATSSTGGAGVAGGAGEAGTYVGGTADAGWIYLGPSGKGVLRGPDYVACPSCQSDEAPIATLSFTFAPTGGSSARLAAEVTGSSDPTWAARLVPSGRLTLTVDAGHSLETSATFGPYTFGSHGELYATNAPCTVAAVSGPVQASEAEEVSVDSVSCSSDGEWAAASAAVHGKGGGFDQAMLLASDAATWVVVDRATVCADHDVTPSFAAQGCAGT